MEAPSRASAGWARACSRRCSGRVSSRAAAGGHEGWGRPGGEAAPGRATRWGRPAPSGPRRDRARDRRRHWSTGIRDVRASRSWRLILNGGRKGREGTNRAGPHGRGGAYTIARPERRGSSDLAAPKPIREVLARAQREGQDGQRGRLVGAAEEDAGVAHEDVAHVVGLTEAVGDEA